jgi:hypothetical protein
MQSVYRELLQLNEMAIEKIWKETKRVRVHSPARAMLKRYSLTIALTLALWFKH